MAVQHRGDVIQASFDGVPGVEVGLCCQVTCHGQCRGVVEKPGAGQVEGVVQKVTPVHGAEHLQRARETGFVCLQQQKAGDTRHNYWCAIQWRKVSRKTEKPECGYDSRKKFSLCFPLDQSRQRSPTTET